MSLRSIAILITTLLFTGSFVSAAPIPDWRPTYLLGISDLQGKEIVPAVYRKIEYKGNGIFIASNIVNSVIEIFNFNGKKLDFILPANSRLVDIHWKKLFLKDAHPVFEEIPDSLLLSFRKSPGIGLCNGSGKVLFEPIYSKIGFAGEGYMFLLKPGGNYKEGNYCWLLDMESLKTIPLSCKVNEILLPMSEGRAVVRPVKHPDGIGFVDTNGKVKMFKKFISASPFKNGMSTVFVKGKEENGVVIDRDYQVISSGKIDVKGFYNGLAVAQCLGPKPRKYGLVDKNFNWKVLPNFTRIGPVFESYGFRRRIGARKPAFYVANKESRKVILMSLRGEILCSFPDGFQYSSLIYSSGKIRCYSVDPIIDTEKMRTHLFTLDRKYMKPSGNGTPTLLVKELAPGRVINRVRRDDGALHEPGGFRRFLEKYDLIGLNVSEVYTLLAPNMSLQKRRNNYLLLHIGGSLGMKIFFRDNKVWKWCFVKGGQEYAPYYNNVVFDTSYRSRSTVPKMKLKTSK